MNCIANKVDINYDYFTLTKQLLLLHLCDPIHTAPGNGGITPTYRWTQTLSDLMIMVPLPEGTKTKALDIVFTNNKLKVNHKPLLLLIDPFLPSCLPARLPAFFPTSFFSPFLSPPHTSSLPSPLHPSTASGRC
jgi:CS domain